MQTCNDETLPHRAACVTRPPRLGRSMRGGKSEAKREIPFRATLLFALRSVLSLAIRTREERRAIMFHNMRTKEKETGRATCLRGVAELATTD